jgi:hypothetical protein
MSISFSFTPTYVFLSDGSSLSGWTNSGITVSSGVGNPAPSFAGTGSSQYAYINPASLSSLVGYIILVDMYATGANPLVDLYFGCNSSGAGQMFRIDARPFPAHGNGFASTTFWTGVGAWSTPPSNNYTLSANTWYTIKIVINSTATNGMSWYYNDILGGTGTFVNNGGYIAMQADGGSGGYWDNIKIYKTDYVPIPASIGFTTIPLVSAIPQAFNTVSSNTLTVSSYTVNTFQNGTYIATASSVSEGKQAWNMLYGAVSNSINTADYWHCAYSGWDGYTQSPYDANGSYVGGGTGFFQSTVVQVAGTIAGEWVQIQLPYKLKLSTYSLYPRQNIGWFSRYPTILYVVGSNNGTTWYQVDYRTLSSTPATNLGAITYTIIPNTGYMYFRLITNALNAGNPAIHYGDWTLTGYASGNDSSIPGSIGYTLIPIPLRISGIRLWLDANDTNTLSLTGTSVNQWNDKSGLGNNAMRYGTLVTNPTYTSTGFNNLPAIQFNSTSSTANHGFIANSPAGTHSNGMYAFVIFQKNGAALNQTPGESLFAKTGNGGNNYIAGPFDMYGTTRLVADGVGNYVNFGSITGLNISTATGLNLFYISIAPGTSNVAIQEYVNGTLGLNATGTPLTNYVDIGTNLYIGLRGNGDCYSGVMSEIIIYNTQPSTTQRQNIEGYLAWKWNLVSQLPAGHPYKTVQPI